MELQDIIEVVEKYDKEYKLEKHDTNYDIILFDGEFECLFNKEENGFAVAQKHGILRHTMQANLYGMSMLYCFEQDIKKWLERNAN